jgi:hypothetical protein
LDIAATYESYGRFETGARFAPAFCAFATVARPPANSGTVPALSRSGDTSTHGRKLYWLFVKDVPYDPAFGYIPTDRPNPVGQVVVKEAWVPEEVKADGQSMKSVSRTVETRVGPTVVKFLPYVQEGLRVYHAKEKAGLFIMYKVDPRTPGTDEGWVYGTVTADGKKVTSAGRIESCMGCHKDAPHDRLFGLLPQDPEPTEDND